MPKTTVFYDGSCPLCRCEIGFYQNRDTKANIQWRNLSEAAECDLPLNLSKSDALSRFHVETADGRLLSGAAAFAHMWSTLPGFRMIGRIAERRFVLPLLEWGYLFFLRYRPKPQKAFR